MMLSDRCAFLALGGDRRSQVIARHAASIPGIAEASINPSGGYRLTD